MTRPPAAHPRPKAQAAPPIAKPAPSGPPSATQAVAGVLQRMGEVLGPGAIYSLVHYGAYEEGLALAAQRRPADAEQAVRTVADLLGLEARLLPVREGRMRVQVHAAPQVSLESRGTAALVVGLLEGMLTAARGGRVQATEPGPAKDGVLEIELDGGRP